MYRLIYDIDYSRIMPAVIIDARASIPAITNQIGSVIKAYTDAEVAKVTSKVVPYKIETDQGVLVGYFTIRVIVGFGSLYQYQLRPAFVQFNTVISQEISNFIASDDWKFDFLS